MEVIYEEITFSLSTAGVPSKKDGSIPVVLIKEGISKNNRNYSRKILQDAIPLFEGAICYDGHSEGVRKPSEIFGRLRNVRTEKEAMRGDLVPVREDGWFKQVRKIFTPSELGLSIHATGKIEQTEIEGKKVWDVREITGGPDNGKPRVDMVLFPAAGGALLESSQDSWINKVKEAILIEEEKEEISEYGGNEMDLTQLTEQVKNLFGMQTQHATEVKGIKEILEKSIKLQEDTQKELQETKKLQVEWQSKAMLLEMLKASKLSEASKQILQENLKGEIDPNKLKEAITKQEKLEEEILKGNTKNPVSQSGAKDNLPVAEDKKAQLQKGMGALFESVMGNVSTATNQEGGQK